MALQFTVFGCERCGKLCLSPVEEVSPGSDPVVTSPEGWGWVGVPPSEKMSCPECAECYRKHTPEAMSMTLIFVDCEGHGPAPGLNDEHKFEFGAVEFLTRKPFHGKGATPETFGLFAKWLAQFPAPLKFVSDNPAYDWQFINYYCWKYLRGNPFGHSARRIGDYYAGLVGSLYASSDWKKLRVTKHDHNPVNDAMGNAEAFARILKGER